MGWAHDDVKRKRRGTGIESDVGLMILDIRAISRREETRMGTLFGCEVDALEITKRIAISSVEFFL